jgi:predicted enzyme related to lactoylglutathione lyase
MSTGVQTSIGRFVWHDLNTTDVEKAKSFYSDLLGWQIEVWKPGEMDYPMISNGGQQHGGFGPAQGGAPSHWLGHVVVDDADAAAARAEKAGGTILVQPMDIPEVGRMAVIADPEGAVVSAFSPAGETPISEGTFVWDELLTSDVEAAKRFYGEVFGWTTGDMAMGEQGVYTLFKRSGDTDAAGCMPIPPEAKARGVPPHWLTYLATDDIDATAARVAELGGTVLMAPWDVPTVGRLAVIADPTGAAFGLCRPSDS